MKVKGYTLIREIRSKRDPSHGQMLALVCPRCHRVRYFPMGTSLREEQPDGTFRMRTCDKCGK